MPSLTEFNPASHVAWLVGGGIMVLLGIALLLDGYDWVRDRIRSRRSGRVGRRPERKDSWRLRDPASTLRERHHRWIFARWYWQRSDQPDHSNARPERASRIDGDLERR